MNTSPLARVFASKPAPSPSLTPPTPSKPTEPNFSQFIDEYMTKTWTKFTPYIDTEPEVRTKAADITKALSDCFRAYEFTEAIMPHDYRPPFAVEWQINKKKDVCK